MLYQIFTSERTLCAHSTSSFEKHPCFHVYIDIYIYRLLTKIRHRNPGDSVHSLPSDSLPFSAA